MDLGSVLLALALLGVVVAYLARPLVERGGEKLTAADHEVSSLLASRERVLDALQELDMDWTMGKLLEPDYRAQRDSLLQEGAEILRRLDELSDESGQALVAKDQRTAIEQEIEAEVARLRAEVSERPEPAFCPACGQPVVAGDRFCTRCGEPLVEEGEP